MAGSGKVLKGKLVLPHRYCSSNENEKTARVLKVVAGPFRPENEKRRLKEARTRNLRIEDIIETRV